jgi:hypothetical protein
VVGNGTQIIGIGQMNKPVVINVELNLEGKYAAVLPYGRIWRDNVDAALALAAFVLGQPVALGEKILVP